MSYVHAFPMHTYSISIYLLYLNCFRTFLIVFFSLPLLLLTLVVSMAPKHKSTPVQNPLRFEVSSSSDSAPISLRFRDDDGRLRRHRPSRCHLQSRMGVTVWRPGHLSSRAYPGVLLQHAQDWSFSTSFLHSRSRYAHSCHTVACYRCAWGS